MNKVLGYAVIHQESYVTDLEQITLHTEAELVKQVKELLEIEVNTFPEAVNSFKDNDFITIPIISFD